MVTAGERAAVMYWARKRRGAARARSQYDTLAGAPFDLGTAGDGIDLPNAFRLPARSRIAVGASQDTTSGQITVRVGSRTYAKAASLAGAVVRLPWGEAGQEVEVTSIGGAPACTVTLYVLDDSLRATAIATGTIT